MSSINTNKGAMVALETLRGINKNLSEVQSQISTGKKVSSSADNAAIWSIATVMESDVKSFDQVSDSLNLGSATVGVARSAADQVTGLLQEAKSLIVAANDPSVSDADRSKYQTDITELTGTIGSIVDAASFNGQNLLKGSGSVDVLSSLNRGEDGTVTAGKISINRNNLSTDAAVSAVTGAAITTGATFATLSNSGTVTENGGTAATITIGAGTTSSATTYSFDIGDSAGAVEFEVAAGLDQDAIAASLETQITAAIAASGDSNVSGNLTVTASSNVLTFANGASADSGNNNITIGSISVANETVAAADAGGLAALSSIDVSTASGASTALDSIDSLLQTAIDATAEFGSKQKRIDNQNEFVTTLKDSLKTGIGAMTDANLEEASARLQSLQVQQQLGVQALSIANQAPQSLLSLFR